MENQHKSSHNNPFTILALETSHEIVSCAVCDGYHLLSQTQLYSYQDLSRRLPQLVTETVKRIGRSLNQIDVIAASLGPGSFTSLRTGLAFAKGLAVGLNKPLLGISSLDALANAIQHLSDALIVCLYPSRPSRPLEVYYARYRIQKGEVHKISHESCEEFPLLLNSLSDGHWSVVLLVGYFNAEIADYWKHQTDGKDKIFVYRRPSAYKIALAAVRRIGREGLKGETDEVTPIYVLPAPPM
ncbi:MAG: tRNA (adenosine(37)-N6)-threonylcarbamoyltransferase complex dimerization subunit type 1 TsaB [Armatimonadetes bacterium]|nr:tRNA (adenosine(37)-N6)-threonylcarbamoyltransferase complex dimerization subunit type 1 TsaB [Armatimonadota bacterium]MDW8121264.1 tRNA (adenosine(37)-N6)-threonylcarbamoyltransferase complex dimerization subunit type 1 TsaB [Armatimonadota bacterium]